MLMYKMILHTNHLSLYRVMHVRLIYSLCVCYVSSDWLVFILEDSNINIKDPPSQKISIKSIQHWWRKRVSDTV